VKKVKTEKMIFIFFFWYPSSHLYVVFMCCFLIQNQNGKFETRRLIVYQYGPPTAVRASSEKEEKKKVKIAPLRFSPLRNFPNQRRPFCAASFHILKRQSLSAGLKSLAKHKVKTWQ